MLMRAHVGRDRPRLSTVLRADLLLVLDSSNVAIPRELPAASGLYPRLHAMQTVDVNAG